MRSLISVLIFSAVILFINSENLFSQIISLPDQSIPAVYDPENNLSKTPEQNFSKEELSIMDEMVRLKSGNTSANRDKISELQIRLEKLNGSTVTMPGTISLSSSSGQDVKAEFQNDQIPLNTIYKSLEGSIKAIATQVEQRSPGNGAIWVIVAAGRTDSGAGATPDTLILFKSVNNGSTYSMIKRIALSTGVKVNYDQMDFEIIEPSVSSKIIHLVFGFKKYTIGGSTRAGLLSFNTSDLSYQATELAFSGSGLVSNNYFFPRITSDNSQYQDAAFITIAVTQDSTDGINHYQLSKTCRINNPYIISPPVTYLSKTILLTFYGLSNSPQTDVAYYNSGGAADGDSIVYVISGFAQLEHAVIICKAYSSTFTYPALRKSLVDFSHFKEFARIASNGGVDQKKLMIVFTEYYPNGSDNVFQLNSYRTSDGVNWSKSTLFGGGSNFFKIKSPDIIGRRNTDGKFYVSLKVETPLKDAVASIHVDNFVTKTIAVDLNNQLTKFKASPKPSFRYVNNDSCLTIWPTNSSVYSSGGNKAIITGIIFYIEGIYKPDNLYGSLDMTTGYLRSSVIPYNKIDSAKSYNLTNFTFTNSTSGSYYISVKSRNSIETWYYQPVNLKDSISNPSLNFSNSISNAYGSNQKLVNNSPVTYAFYSGDVNQDGIIDVADLVSINNDANNFITGYVNTDVNGDDIVDVSDVVISFNNSSNFVSVIRP
ncbi:MAG: hypothetical protein ABI528_04605 [bacterium]